MLRRFLPTSGIACRAFRAGAPAPRGALARALSSRPPRGAPPDEDDEDEDDDMLEEHPAVKRRVDAVRVVHARYTEVELELSKKVEALMLEYDVKLAPFLARRAEIVSGRSEPTDAEARPLADYLAVCDVPPGEAEPGIPAFWLTAITEHEALADSVTEGDAAVLEYLQDVQCRKFNPGERTWAPLAKGPKPDLAELEQLNGFELIFEFAPNPHFEGTVLRKVVWTDEGYPAATQGSQIKWSPGMDITHK
ncbi:hypothetical protein T492DRAFT_863985, partial [Pavlovales sp. CCMP2436]